MCFNDVHLFIVWNILGRTYKLLLFIKGWIISPYGVFVQDQVEDKSKHLKQRIQACYFQGNYDYILVNKIYLQNAELMIGSADDKFTKVDSPMLFILSKISTLWHDF